MPRTIHLLVAGEHPYSEYRVPVQCGWPKVTPHRATMNYREVTCARCLGAMRATPEPKPAPECRMVGYSVNWTKPCRERFPTRPNMWCRECKAKAQTASPQGDGDPRPLE